MKKILLQTTIPYAKDDWSIERFSILAEVLSAIRDENGSRLFQITARNRENPPSGNDRVLSKIDEILDWEKSSDCDRDTKFVELGRYLCEVRA